jgi:hypothetical protein
VKDCDSVLNTSAFSASEDLKPAQHVLLNLIAGVIRTDSDATTFDLVSKMIEIGQAHRFESRESIRRLVFKWVMDLVDDDHHDTQFWLLVESTSGRLLLVWTAPSMMNGQEYSLRKFHVRRVHHRNVDAVSTKQILC